MIGGTGEPYEDLSKTGQYRPLTKDLASPLKQFIEPPAKATKLSEDNKTDIGQT